LDAHVARLNPVFGRVDDDHWWTNQARRGDTCGAAIGVTQAIVRAAKGKPKQVVDWLWPNG
jgi:hypothetical protein